MIITYPTSATITPTMDHVMAVFAVLILPSSPAAVRYMMPATTKAMIARNPKIVRTHVINPEMISRILALGSCD